MFHVKHDQENQINSYVALIKTYHKTLDLISDKGLQEIAAKITDAKIYASCLMQITDDNQTVLDIGSGIGLPAIIMAISIPGLSFCLVERRQRRVAFLRIVKAKLALDNLTILAKDVRNVTTLKASVITAQAVGSFAYLYRISCHLQAKTVVLLSRKGDDWQQEIGDLEADLGLPCPAERLSGLSACGSLIKVLVPGGLRCPP